MSSSGFTAPLSVRVKESTDGAVGLDIAQGINFSMNPVATFIWNELRAGHNPTQIAEHISSTYEISPDQARGDVNEFIELLVSRGLLTTSEAGSTADLAPKLSWKSRLHNLWRRPKRHS